MRSRLGSIICWVGFVALLAVYGVGWQYHLPLGPLLSILIVGLGALMLARYLQRPKVETPAPEAKAASSVGVNMFVLWVAAVIVPAATTDNLPVGKIIGVTLGLLVVVGALLFVRMMVRMRGAAGGHLELPQRRHRACRSRPPRTMAQYIETRLTAQHLRPLQIVRAFAEATDVRQAGVSAMSLANLRPHYKGEFAYLGKEWPEMAAFLAANGLD